MGIIRKMNGFDANGCDSYYFCGIRHALSQSEIHTSSVQTRTSGTEK